MPGPFTPDTRAEILERLLTVQGMVGRELISPTELARVREIWRDDALVSSGRFAAVKEMEG